MLHIPLMNMVALCSKSKGKPPFRTNISQILFLTAHSEIVFGYMHDFGKRKSVANGMLEQG